MKTAGRSILSCPGLKSGSPATMETRAMTGGISSGLRTTFAAVTGKQSSFTPPSPGSWIRRTITCSGLRPKSQSGKWCPAMSSVRKTLLLLNAPGIHMINLIIPTLSLERRKRKPGVGRIGPLLLQQGASRLLGRPQLPRENPFPTPARRVKSRNDPTFFARILIIGLPRLVAGGSVWGKFP